LYFVAAGGVEEEIEAALETEEASSTEGLEG